MEKNEQSLKDLRGLQEVYKCTCKWNLCGQERKKRKEKIFEEIRTENSPHFIKTMSKGSPNFKWDKDRETYTDVTTAHHCRSAESPRQNLGSHKRKRVHRV